MDSPLVRLKDRDIYPKDREEINAIFSVAVACAVLVVVLSITLLVPLVKEIIIK